MNYSGGTWNQLKNLTADDLIRALEKDRWKPINKKSAIRVFRHPDGRRVSIHYHPSKTFGPNLLKALLEDIGWTEQDMKWLKLIR